MKVLEDSSGCMRLGFPYTKHNDIGLFLHKVYSVTLRWKSYIGIDNSTKSHS